MSTSGASVTLNKDQEEFLEKCSRKFSNRFTEDDEEYKQILNSDLPKPPIVFPWYGRPKLTAYRHKGHGSRNYENPDFGRNARRDRSDYQDRYY